MSRALVPQPLKDVLGRLQADLARHGETLRTTDLGAVRYYRRRPDGQHVRIACPGGHAEYPLGRGDRVLLGLP